MTKKKSIVMMVLAFCLIVPAMFLFSACGKKAHEHNYSAEWTTDAANHWHAATCEHADEKADFAAHTFGDWSEKTPAGVHTDKIEKRTCSECGYEETRPVANSALHEFGATWKSDETNHWHECSCGRQADVEAHDFEPIWISDEKSHWFECDCGAKAYEEAHKYGDWSEKTPAGIDQNRQLSRKCTECEYEDVLTFDNTKTNGSYCMVITSVINVSGEKKVEVKILRGTIRVGENLSVDGINGTFTIDRIEVNYSTAESASYGQTAYLVLGEEDGDLTQITNSVAGTLMYAPDSAKSYKTFTAQIYFYEKDDANNVGRNTPILTGTSSLEIALYDEGRLMPCTITLPEGVEMIKPGETMIATITLESEKALWEGLEFNINDGSRILVKGTILSVVGE